jgi:hypothetical protein
MELFNLIYPLNSIRVRQNKFNFFAHFIATPSLTEPLSLTTCYFLDHLSNRADSATTKTGSGSKPRWSSCSAKIVFITLLLGSHLSFVFVNVSLGAADASHELANFVHTLLDPKYHIVHLLHGMLDNYLICVFRLYVIGNKIEADYIDH